MLEADNFLFLLPLLLVETACSAEAKSFGLERCAPTTRVGVN